jgi:hypothetical protein
MSGIAWTLLWFSAGLTIGTATQRWLRKLDARNERLALELIRDGNPMLPDRLQSAWMQEVAGKALGEKP